MAELIESFPSFKSIVKSPVYSSYALEKFKLRVSWEALPIYSMSSLQLNPKVWLPEQMFCAYQIVDP